VEEGGEGLLALRVLLELDGSRVPAGCLAALAGCIETISRHASIRRYAEGAIPGEHLGAIIEAARRAPTSWNLQPLSVVALVDSEAKARVAEAVSQPFAARAAAILVYSVDYAKLLAAAREAGVEPAEPGLGHLAVALIDVGIASAWSLLAAEELGYGGVYIALYSNPCRVADALDLPPAVLPVVALALGRPGEKPRPRKRQPVEAFAGLGGYPSADPRGLAGHHGAGVLRHVLGRGGYYEEVGRRLAECARSRGFSL
jgi:nitroreductase